MSVSSQMQIHYHTTNTSTWSEETESKSNQRQRNKSIANKPINCNRKLDNSMMMSDGENFKPESENNIKASSEKSRIKQYQQAAAAAATAKPRQRRRKHTEAIGNDNGPDVESNSACNTINRSYILDRLPSLIEPATINETMNGHQHRSHRNVCLCSSRWRLASKYLDASSWRLPIERPLKLNAKTLSYFGGKSSSSWMSGLLIFICHIVVISLILHKLPPNSQAFALIEQASDDVSIKRLAYQDFSKKLNELHQTSEQQHIRKRSGSRASNRIDSFIHEYDSNQASNRNQADNEQLNFDNIVASRLMALYKAEQDQQQQLHRMRQRRHTIYNLEQRRTRSHSPSELAEVGSSRIASSSKLQPGSNLDCQKLAVLWMFLQSIYPALSSHLAQLAAQVGNKPAGDQQFLWANSSESARSAHRLLEEAEKSILSGSPSSHYKTRPHAYGHVNGGQQQTSAGWLQRVNLNPAYSRLIQHLRANKQHQGRTESIEPPRVPQVLMDGTNGDEPNRLRVEGNRSGISEGGAGATGEQLEATASSSQQHFGRLVHYPHEISSAGNSNGMSRTLDKLRLLNHHSRKAQRTDDLINSDMDSNGLRQSVASINNDLQQQRDASDSESAIDSARNNFVYGKVLLRPEQPNELSATHYERPNSLSTLRELANEQQRQFSQTGGQVKTNSLTRSMDGGAFLGPQQSDLLSSPSTSTSDIYGRILTSPPNNESANQRRRQSQEDGKSINDHHRQPQVSLPEHNNQPQRTFDDGKIKDLIHGSAGRSFNVGFIPSASDSINEMMQQQRSQQVSINGEQNDGEEFEGEFHSEPLKEIEVRQLRSSDAPSERQKQHGIEVVLTKTSNPSSMVKIGSDH